MPEKCKVACSGGDGGGGCVYDIDNIKEAMKITHNYGQYGVSFKFL